MIKICICVCIFIFIYICILSLICAQSRLERTPERTPVELVWSRSYILYIIYIYYIISYTLYLLLVFLSSCHLVFLSFCLLIFLSFSLFVFWFFAFLSLPRLHGTHWTNINNFLWHWKIWITKQMFFLNFEVRCYTLTKILSASRSARRWLKKKENDQNWILERFIWVSFISY